MQLTALTYNMNRGKKSKALSDKDLYQYASREDLDLPDGRFGAAMLKAIDNDLFPNWGLFIYKDLAKSADKIAPEVLIGLCSDALVLAPEYDGTHLSGLYIITESASGNVRQLVTNDNTVYTVEIPKTSIKYVAEQHTLRVLQCHQLTPSL